MNKEPLRVACGINKFVDFRENSGRINEKTQDTGDSGFIREQTKVGRKELGESWRQ